MSKGFWITEATSNVKS